MRRRSGPSSVRGRSSGRRSTPRRDPRLPPFDSRQPLSWRAFFRRLAMRFRSLTRPTPLPAHDYNWDLVGDKLVSPSVAPGFPLLGQGTCH